jgi:DNA-binding NtrC family response regulator
MTDRYLDFDSFNVRSEESPIQSSKRNGDLITVGMTFKEVEEKLMLKTLHHCGYNKEKAAQMLGISVKTLFNRLKTSNDDDRDSLQK